MFKTKPTEVETCKERLQFLDYLRKSQCTRVSGLNGGFVDSTKNCRNALVLLEKVANECIAAEESRNGPR